MFTNEHAERVIDKCLSSLGAVIGRTSKQISISFVLLLYVIRLLGKYRSTLWTFFP